MADWQKKCAKRQCYEDNGGRIERILVFWGGDINEMLTSFKIKMLG